MKKKSKAGNVFLFLFTGFPLAYEYKTPICNTEKLRGNPIAGNTAGSVN
jgi:hypothetical protein